MEEKRRVNVREGIGCGGLFGEGKGEMGKVEKKGRDVEHIGREERK